MLLLFSSAFDARKCLRFDASLGLKEQQNCKGSRNLRAMFRFCRFFHQFNVSVVWLWFFLCTSNFPEGKEKKKTKKKPAIASNMMGNERTDKLFATNTSSKLTAHRKRSQCVVGQTGVYFLCHAGWPSNVSLLPCVLTEAHVHEKHACIQSKKQKTKKHFLKFL